MMMDTSNSDEQVVKIRDQRLTAQSVSVKVSISAGQTELACVQQKRLDAVGRWVDIGPSFK